MTDTISTKEKIRAIYQVATFNPAFTGVIFLLSLVAATFEGIGIGFIVPIVQMARGDGGGGDMGQFVQVFADLYTVLGVPFALEYVLVGVGVVITLRYAMSFLVSWLTQALRVRLVRFLREQAFEHALEAEVGYYDRQGSDGILNAIITETAECGGLVKYLVKAVRELFLSLVYAGIALYLSPVLTIFAAVLLGVLTVAVRYVVEAGYSVGERVSEANERVQETVQAGTQGIRDVKLFALEQELLAGFERAMDQYERSRIALQRNTAAIDNLYQWAAALTVFFLIYVSLEYTDLSLAGLGVFLFAMFRLAPRVSTLNNVFYEIDGRLPHLITAQSFVREMESRKEPRSGSKVPPDPVDRVAFEDVAFAYEDEQVLDAVSFAVDRDEFVAFVGQSGTGKSTIVSLLARFYEPDAGQIRANGTPIDEFDLPAWRSRISVVRQHPHIFNDTLRYNLTVGNQDATEKQLHHVCEIAQVTEFLDELPDGLETNLGDDGVRLSGGQRQRIAVARALLKDADYLLLDEATSDLDSNLEEKVHAGIESLDHDRGLIVIAHRLSTVVNADRVYAMEDGRIVEVGPHDELLSSDGLYADLYATKS